MQIPMPTLTESRRAGLLAAVAVYPLTRLAGTLHRPTLDRALVSGAAMAVAYASASSTTKVVSAASGVLPGGRVILGDLFVPLVRAKDDDGSHYLSVGAIVHVGLAF